ncbi:hypothetical protein [Olivibacter jilunii]|uniref:hypothetical protein n=1 Tax=Olivibacter jilunii TaxID=985016 RepID=UPI001030E4EC|nr:hypothetical protein [Olivibacter jilunii]
MKRNYVFEWFDTFVYHELNPRHIDLQLLEQGRAGQLSEEATKQKWLVVQSIREQVIQVKKEKHGQVLLKAYYHSLVNLMDIVFNYKATVNQRTSTKYNELLLHVEGQLNDLFGVFDKEYSFYIRERERLPFVRLLPVRNMVREKVETIVRQLSNDGHPPGPIRIIYDFLMDFVARIDNKEQVSSRHVNFVLGMLDDLEKVTGVMSVNDCPHLHELLIYWNLNIKPVVDYFIGGKDQFMAGLGTMEEKLAWFRKELMKVQQIPEKPGVAFDPGYPSLRHYFIAYLSSQISYLEKWETNGIMDNEGKQESLIVPQSVKKIKIPFSVDQIALLLRAFFEIGFFEIKSFRALCKLVVPAISTLKVLNPSWDSFRVKSRTPERSDLDVVNNLLDRAKEQLNTY